jgi:HlyD family secretion protein
LLLLGACAPKQAPDGYQGYVEAELVDVAAPFAGTLDELAVTRGQSIEPGTLLFRLDDTAEQAALAAARGRLQAARARVRNLLAARRTPELEALQAQAESARAAAELSRVQLEQAERLYASSFVSRARLDEARAHHAIERARVAEAEAQIVNASVAIGRAGEVAAAQADARAAAAEVDQHEWQVGQKARSAPMAAVVYDTYYNPPEWVAAGAPVVSLLPPAHLKLRFFVPEPELSSLAIGARVQASCNGCPQPIAATVTYVSPRPEYTPPIIFSRETRSKLVFLVEARPETAAAAGLHPGQPIDVRRAGPPPAAPK